MQNSAFATMILSSEITQLGLLNSIYCHIRWSNRENRLLINDRHSTWQATTELCRSLFDRLLDTAAAATSPKMNSDVIAKITH